MIEVITRYCPQNHPCPTVRLCPTGALQQKGYRAPAIDDEKCIECGRCTEACRVFHQVG